MSVIEIELTQGYTAIIDSEDAELAYKYDWFAGINRYKGRDRVHARTSSITPVGSLGRMVMERVLGRPLEHELSEKVRFIDGDPLNCRRSNLTLEGRKWKYREWAYDEPKPAEEAL